MGQGDVPKDDAAIFSPAASMLKSTGGQRRIDGDTSTSSCEPSVDDQACAGIQAVSVGVEIDVVDGVQKGRRRDLGSLGTGAPRSSQTFRRHGIHGHAVRHG